MPEFVYRPIPYALSLSKGLTTGMRLHCYVSRVLAAIQSSSDSRWLVRPCSAL